MISQWLAIEGYEAAQALRGALAKTERLSRLAIEVLAPAGLALVADPLRLEQARGDLIDNALSHGTGDVTVTVAQSGGGADVWISLPAAG
jgi:signal transduction histidine kinase